jgi:hypothetical protein
MDSFWQWLMRANARGVCAAAIAGLLLTGGWWTWREFAPAPQDSRLKTHDRRDRKWEALGLMAMVDSILSPTNGVPANPFVIPGKRRARPAVALTPGQTGPVVEPDVKIVQVDGVKVTVAPGEPDRTFEAAFAVKPKPKPTPPATKPAVKPEREPPPVSLTYRGMFRRPDGKPVALIEDSESEGSRFYEVGQEAFGLEIGEPGDEGACLVLADGTTLTIPLGEPTRFREGRHVD